MIRCTLTLILILVSVALAACLPGSAQVAPTDSLPAAAPANETPAAALAPTLTAMAPASSTPGCIVIVAPSATPTATATWTPRPAATSAATPTALPPSATPTPEGPAVLVRANANIRSGPGTAYPVIGSARAGDRLSVTGQARGFPGDVKSPGNVWWQIAFGGRAGWIWGALVTANTAAAQAPGVIDFPPPPTDEVKATVEAQDTQTPSSTSAMAPSLPDMV